MPHAFVARLLTWFKSLSLQCFLLHGILGCCWLPGFQLFQFDSFVHVYVRFPAYVGSRSPFLFSNLSGTCAPGGCLHVAPEALA